MKIDRIDSEILGALQNNARMSNKELAATVGLAPSSCLERVRRLQEGGVLLGFHAEIDPRAVGVELEALVSVRLKNHSRGTVEALRERTLAYREVLGIYYLAGPIDFLVHVAVNNPLHLRNLVLEAFSTHDEVDRVETSLIFDYSRRWSLPHFGPEALDA